MTTDLNLGMKKICVIGTGYVGLVTGACFAEMGHRVTCVDIDPAKVEALNAGRIPIYEPGLDTVVHKNIKAKRFSVTTSYDEGLRGADYVFMCVGTPTTPEGKVDLSYIQLAYMNVNAALDGRKPIMINKSTVPPGTADMFQFILSGLGNGNGAPAVASNPEFLREGHAVHDFMYPTRVVIGSDDHQVAESVAELYRPLDCPMIFTTTRTAEMIKYASNAFLATKVSFINDIATLCDSLNVNVDYVAAGIGLDPRIGKDYLKAGIGYGGSCLPKDLAGLTNVAASVGQELKILDAVSQVNSQLPNRLVQQVKTLLGGSLQDKRIALFGLTFKPQTDDMRFSPALEVLKALREEGADVVATDPQVWRRSDVQDQVDTCEDLFEAARDAEAVVLATDWSVYKDMDLDTLKTVMTGDVLADGRNALDAKAAQQAGFRYIGVGRGEEIPQEIAILQTTPAITE